MISDWELLLSTCGKLRWLKRKLYYFIGPQPFQGAPQVWRSSTTWVASAAREVSTATACNLKCMALNFPWKMYYFHRTFNFMSILEFSATCLEKKVGEWNCFWNSMFPNDMIHKYIGGFFICRGPARSWPVRSWQSSRMPSHRHSYF
jgi:hypothetical protein